MIETNFAFLFDERSFRIPLLPIVLKTYEEYGPGKPFKESMNNPSSSIIIGFLHLENASLALFSAISFREFDCISSKFNLKKPNLSPNESRMFLASLYLCEFDDTKYRSNDLCIPTTTFYIRNQFSNFHIIGIAYHRFVSK